MKLGEQSAHSTFTRSEGLLCGTYSPPYHLCALAWPAKEKQHKMARVIAQWSRPPDVVPSARRLSVLRVTISNCLAGPLSARLNSDPTPFASRQKTRAYVTTNHPGPPGN